MLQGRHFALRRLDTVRPRVFTPPNPLVWAADGQGAMTQGEAREPRPVEASPPGRLGRLWRTAFAGDWSRTLLVVILVGGVLALSGAFHTADLPLAGRFAYWLSLVVLGAVLGRASGRLIIPQPWWETRPVTVVSLMIPMIGLPMTLVACLADNWMHHGRLSLWQVREVLPACLATTAVLTILVFLVQRRAAVETHEAPKGAPPPRFLARLPAKLAGADLWAIEAQDHYLRLHTSKGDDLILMRLADALVELEGIEGARTHRSWWVARHAVASAERAEGRATLTLVGGLKAPVSRAYLKPLREAGWF